MVESDDYFEEEEIELTDLCVMNLLVTYVSHRLPQATCHLPPHFTLMCLPTHLLPLAFSTPAASAHSDPLQHHLYPLFKGWGQLCVSPLQGSPLRTRDAQVEKKPTALSLSRALTPSL